MLSILRAPEERAAGFRARKVRCDACCLQEFCAPGELPREDIGFLQKFVKKQELRLRRGQALYSDGDEFRALFAIHTGSFKVVSAGRVTGFAFAGDMMGLSGIDSGRHADCAIALEESGICVLAWERVEEAAIRIPLVRRQLIRMLSREIRREQEMSALLGRLSAEERVGAFLAALSRRYATRGFEASRFRMPMSRSEIGSFLGLTSETVSRLISRLRKDGLLRARGRQIEISDVPRLQGLAGRLELPAAVQRKTDPAQERAPAQLMQVK